VVAQAFLRFLLEEYVRIVMINDCEYCGLYSDVLGIRKSDSSHMVIHREKSLYLLSKCRRSLETHTELFQSTNVASFVFTAMADKNAFPPCKSHLLLSI
jgi:hypothetical protein